MGAFNIQHIDVNVLDQFRSQTDQVADQTVQKIIDSGSLEQVNELLSRLFRNDTFEPGMFSDLGQDLSITIDSYFETTSVLPSWADEDLIKKGEEIFSSNGPEIFMLLNVSSLPLCYTCAKGAQVLYETGRLLTHNGKIDPLARRLMETAQMVVNVLSEGGLSPNGKGIITIQKVRLIHASIRHYLKAGQYHGNAWDVQAFDQPINQEDLAGTLMSFGPVILKGLEKLNVNLSEEEQSAYMHCWKVVGFLMGIDEKLLPDTYEQGYELATKILQHQAAPSEAGKALTQSCIQFISAIIPGTAFDEFPDYLMHYFLEDFSESSGVNLTECIGITVSDQARDRIALRLTTYVVGKISSLDDHPVIRKLIDKFNKSLLYGIIHHFNDGKNVHFYIPPSLQKNWGVSPTWMDHRILIRNIMGNRITWQKEDETLSE